MQLAQFIESKYLRLLTKISPMKTTAELDFYLSILKQTRLEIACLTYKVLKQEWLYFRDISNPASIFFFQLCRVSSSYGHLLSLSFSEAEVFHDLVLRSLLFSPWCTLPSHKEILSFPLRETEIYGLWFYLFLISKICKKVGTSGWLLAQFRSILTWTDGGQLIQRFVRPR